MTDEMLALARENQRKAGVANVEFLKGEIEHMPLPERPVDVIISNCVINLSPDKDAVLAEAFRVLKPGGRFAVSDVVVRGEVPAAVRKNMELWIGCIAGALEESVYRAKLEKAGFEAIDIEPTRVYSGESARSVCSAAGLDAEAIAAVEGKFISAFIRARKPICGLRCRAVATLFAMHAAFDQLDSAHKGGRPAPHRHSTTRASPTASRPSRRSRGHPTRSRPSLPRRPIGIRRWSSSETGSVVAWASAGPYRSRAAYAGVAEHSVYVARGARGTGAGRAALEALCRVYAERGFWKIVSRIFPENTRASRCMSAAGSAWSASIVVTESSRVSGAIASSSRDCSTRWSIARRDHDGEPRQWSRCARPRHARRSAPSASPRSCQRSSLPGP